MSKAKPARPRFFETAQAFRAWLDAHAATEAELLVGYYKRDSGRPSMTWPESVDEALCVGWIDGVRRRIDEISYSIRFTPRRPTSIWSAINIAKFEQLLAAGRVAPAGLRAWEQRTAARSVVYSYEQEGVAELATAEIARFRSNGSAWRYFESVPPGYRKLILHWIISAKREETRAARLGKLIAACAAGQRLR